MKEGVIRSERVYRINVEEHVEYCPTRSAFTKVNLSSQFLNCIRSNS
ncbi:MAG: hypothetical protein QXQ91_04530 [Nanopusillaceae archaeon]